MPEVLMDEYANLESELQAQLEEYERTLEDISAALLQDSSVELQQAEEELKEAIKATRDGLLHIKRERLLHEIDTSIVQNEDPYSANRVSQGASTTEVPALTDNNNSWKVGSKCRFKYIDGRIHVGEIVDWSFDENSKDCKVIFSHPWSDSVKPCYYFQLGRCRFGDSCKFSHGVTVLKSSLKNVPPFSSAKFKSGLMVSAKDTHSGLWSIAEIESISTLEGKDRFGVIFSSSGKRSILTIDEVYPANESIDSKSVKNNDDSDSVDSIDSDDNSEPEEIGGLGSDTFHARFPEASEMAAAGVQSETVNFADWEKHTRGVASKLLVAMGFREGSGLGKLGQGRQNPIEVTVLPSRTSLGFVEIKGDDGEKKKKRRGRGGERRRKQKLAEERRKEKAEMDKEFASDMFSFINDKLSNVLPEGTEKAKTAKSELKVKGKTKNDDGGKSSRVELLERENKINELAAKVAKLEEMSERNRKKDKSVFVAVERKLVEVRAQLQKEEQEKTKQETKLKHREGNKKLKF